MLLYGNTYLTHIQTHPPTFSILRHSCYQTNRHTSSNSTVHSFLFRNWAIDTDTWPTPHTHMHVQSHWHVVYLLSIGTYINSVTLYMHTCRSLLTFITAQLYSYSPVYSHSFYISSFTCHTQTLNSASHIVTLVLSHYPTVHILTCFHLCGDTQMLR